MDGTLAPAADSKCQTRVEGRGAGAPQASRGQRPAKRSCVEFELSSLQVSVDEVDIRVGHRFSWHRCKARGLKLALELAVGRHNVALEDAQVLYQPFQRIVVCQPEVFAPGLADLPG